MAEVGETSSAPASRVKASDVAGLYDVAISFTARDPKAAELADELARELRRAGVKTFYFRNIDEAAEVLGDRLSFALPDIYENRALVVVLVGSEQYGKTHWTGIELDAALRRPADDAGRTRIVPISADGCRIERLPEDVIALTPGTASGRPTLQTVVQILLARCGKRRPWVDRFGPWLLAGFALMCGVVQLTVPGASSGLDLWMAGLAIAGVVFALLWRLGPSLWMMVRRYRAKALVVVNEGGGVRRLRSSAAVLSGLVGIGVAALAAAGVAAVIDARLRLRDVETLVNENALSAAFNRFEASGDRLADFKAETIGLLRGGMERLVSGDWRDFPDLYPRFTSLARKPDEDLEDAFLKATGVDNLKPGDDVEDHVAAAFAMRATSPRIANRLLQTAFARRLEWLMDGNSFYYDGGEAWLLYRTLSEAQGRTEWMKANADKAISPSNEGLSPVITLQLAAEGDVDQQRRIKERIASGRPGSRFLVQLSESQQPEAFAAELAPMLRGLWEEAQAATYDARTGNALAMAIATVDAADGAAFLLEKGRAARSENELLDVIAGLLRTRAATPASVVAQVDAFLTDVKAAGSERIGYAFIYEIEDEPGCASDRCRLHTGLARWRAQAGEVDTPARPFAEVLADYVALGQPPGGYMGAMSHVELLREMGRTDDPKAIAFLRESFDTLAHGNMRLAAIESLFWLTGSFEARSIEEMQKLANMDSSIYRMDMVGLLATMEEPIRTLPADQQGQLLAIITQITTTGDGIERARMLRLLAKFDPATAERRALSLASASRRDDQLEGLEVLMELWRSGAGAPDQ